MLLLTRNKGQRIIIGDYDIVLQVTDVKQQQVKIGVQAAKDVKILRKEIIKDDSTQ